MEEFIKCLRHYADFSGRARRKEYWSFVLFSMIFAILWGIIIVLMFVAIKNLDIDGGSVSNVLVFYYPSLLLLIPNMAVAVRRLHDLGKSGWMMLLSLIPIVGGIWLFVLMITDGQEGTNKYGPDPKTSKEIFDEQIQLKNIGTVFIIASILGFLSMIVSQYIYIQRGMIESIFNNSTIWGSIILILNLLVGIFFLNGKSFSDTKNNVRNGFILILLINIVAIGRIFFSQIHFLKDFSYHSYIVLSTDLALRLSGALLAAALLFKQKSHSLIRTAAILTIIFAVIKLLLYVYTSIAYIGAPRDNLSSYSQLINSLDIFIFVAVFIVLAGTVMNRLKEIIDGPIDSSIERKQPIQPKKETPLRGGAEQNMGGKVYYERDNRGMRVDNLVTIFYSD